MEVTNVMTFQLAPHTHRHANAFALTLLVIGFTFALATPSNAQGPADNAVDSATFQPIHSSGRVAADIARDAAARHGSVAAKLRSNGGQGTAAGAAGTLAVGQSSGAKRGGSAYYDWQLMQTWYPGDNGLQWCVSGVQTAEPLGGVKLYRLNNPYTGLSSLQPFLLNVTLKAQETVPAPPNGATAAASMPHEFDYATCVAPEFTQVGTYVTAVTFCGNKKECAQNPHVSTTTVTVKPFMVSFDTCVDRTAGVVEVFVSALYFDKRPTTASVQFQLDGAAQATTASSDGSWLYLDSRMSLADYDRRFGAGGDSAVVSIASDSGYTPQGQLQFSQSSWLAPCRD